MPYSVVPHRRPVVKLGTTDIVIAVFFGWPGACFKVELRGNAIEEVEVLAQARWRVGMNIDKACLLYTSPSPRDGLLSRMPSSA